MINPEKAKAFRRAAALWTHWADDEMEGVEVVFDELEPAATEWMMLVMALLDLGGNIVLAAEDGDADKYLAEVLIEASVDELKATS